MRSWIDHDGDVTEEPSPSLIAELVQAGQLFWLDIENPTDEVIDRLAARLGLHPLAVEDSKQSHPRAAPPDRRSACPVRHAPPQAVRAAGHTGATGAARGGRPGCGRHHRHPAPGRSDPPDPAPGQRGRGEIQHIVADLTAIEERCISLLGLHASIAGNHLAVVSRRLAAVATIFLPISFLAGFWGQNFNVLTSTIETGWTAFLILGVD